LRQEAGSAPLGPRTPGREEPGLHSTTQGTASSGAQPGSENEPGIDLGYPPAKPDSPAPSPDDPRGSGTVGFGENSTGAGTIKHQAARGVGWTSSLQMYRVVLQMITTWIL